MSLGVLNNIAAIYAQNNLNNTQNSLQNTLTQLSSGSRINSGADDAAGLAVADGLSANEAALTQSAANASDGIGLLQTADGALSQVTNLLNRAVTLSTEAANGTLTTNQASSANQEYQNILNEIGNIGSTTNFNSNNVFSNTARTVFVSDGTVSGANSYADVVGALTTKSIGQSVAVGSASSISAQAGTTAGNTVVSSLAVTVTSGGTLSGTNFTIGLAGGAQHTVNFSGSVSQATFIAAINNDSTFAQEGITAVQTDATHITFSGPGDGSGTLAFGGTLTDSTSGALTTSGASTGATGKASKTLTLPSAALDTFGGSLSIQVGGGATNTLQIAAGTSGTNLVSQINGNAAYQTAGVSASYASSTGVLTITGPAGTGNSLTVGALLSYGPPATGSAAGVGIDFTNSAISTLSAGTAQTVLTSVTAAIAGVAYQRGIIGADVNQLTAASNVASTESVNLASAESNIRATNYGQATSDLAKYKVLDETGISALAQANSVQQEVTKLLQ